MRSQIFPGVAGAGAVILLHGLTASPPAWRAVAEELAARGRTVIVPRLLLHGHADRMTTVLGGIRVRPLVDDVAAIVRGYIKYDENPISLDMFRESTIRAYQLSTTPPHGPSMILVDGDLAESEVRVWRVVTTAVF